MDKLKVAGNYLAARLAESKTWAAVVLAITGGAALSSPFNYLAILAGIIGALAKTP